MIRFPKCFFPLLLLQLQLLLVNGSPPLLQHQPINNNLLPLPFLINVSVPLPQSAKREGGLRAAKTNPRFNLSFPTTMDRKLRIHKLEALRSNDDIKRLVEEVQDTRFHSINCMEKLSLGRRKCVCVCYTVTHSIILFR